MLRKLAQGMLNDPVLFVQKTTGNIPYFYQEELLRCNDRFIAACWARQLGKSWIVRMKAIYQAFTYPDQLIIIISATEKQALHFYRLLMKEIQDSDLLRNEIARYTKTMAVLKNGSQIICLAPSEKSVRGYSADLVIIDEADFVAREVIVAVEQCITARYGKMILISTPSPEGIGSLFYQYFNDGLRAQREGLVGTDEHKFKYRVFHYTYEVGLQVTRVERGQRRTQLDPHMIAIKRKTMAEWEWKREYMAEWADSVGTYYNRLHIESCTDKNYRMMENQLGKGMKEYIGEFEYYSDCIYFAGADFAKQIDKTVLAICRTMSDGGYKIVYFFEAQGVDYTIQGYYIVKALGRYKVSMAWGDKSGVGEPFIDYISRLAREDPECDNLQKIEPVALTNLKKQEIFGNTIPIVAQQHIVFPNHPQFLQEMIYLKRELTPEGMLKINGPTEMDDINDDYPMAFALMMMCELKSNYSRDFFVTATPQYAEMIKDDRRRDAFGETTSLYDKDEMSFFYTPDGLDSTMAFSFNRGIKRTRSRRLF